MLKNLLSHGIVCKILSKDLTKSERKIIYTEQDIMDLPLDKPVTFTTFGTDGKNEYLWLDFDCHHVPLEELSDQKKLVQELLDADIFLSQYDYLSDSGGGIHAIYHLPDRLPKFAIKELLTNLHNYIHGIDNINSYFDAACTVAKSYLGFPGTMNLKYNVLREIIADDCGTIDEDFWNWLQTPHKDHTAKVSTKKAMRLVGMEHLAVGGRNHKCPFIDLHGIDRKPSFRYYPDTDTYFCFKCAAAGGFDGEHFLKNVGRGDLVVNLKAASDVRMGSSYTLTETGRLVLNEKKKTIPIADFFSRYVITGKDIIGRKHTYIKLENSGVIKIDDLPSNRSLKKRYYDAGYNFLIDYQPSNLVEYLERYRNLAVQKEEPIVFCPGINKEQYYWNGAVYPEESFDVLVPFHDENKRTIPEYSDMSSFVKALIDDGNYTHVAAMLWMFACTAKDLWVNQCKLFPLLVATGDANTGKSQLGRMVLSFFGLRIADTLNVTDFAAIKRMSDMGSFPIHFDEYARKYKEDNEEERLKQIAVQYPYIEYRGNADRSMEPYPLLACPIITGEHHLRDGGLMTRGLLLNLGLNKRRNNRAYREWMGAVDGFKTMGLMREFLLLYDKYRKYVRMNAKAHTRPEVIAEVITVTLGFLYESRLLSEGLIDLEELIAVLANSENIKNNNLRGDYGDIMEEFGDFDDNELEKDQYLCQQLDAAFHIINDRYLGMVPMKAYKLLSDISPRLKTFIPTHKNFINTLIQSSSTLTERNQFYVNGRLHRRYLILEIDTYNCYLASAVARAKKIMAAEPIDLVEEEIIGVVGKYSKDEFKQERELVFV